MPSHSLQPTMPTSLSCALALSLILGSGCSSPSGERPVSPSLGEPAAPVAVDECTSEPACIGPEVDDDGNAALCVHVVEAWVETEDGKPAQGFRAQVCSSNLCNTTTSDEAGLARFSLCKNMIEPAFEIPGRAKYVTYAIPITSAVSTLGHYRLVPLAAAGVQVVSGSGGDRTFASGGAVVRVPNEVEVAVNDMEYSAPDDQRFRAARLGPDAAPGLAQSSPGLELFYGMAPAGTRFFGPVRLTIPNSEGWEPGTSVELFEQGVDDSGTPASPRRWGRAGTGAVSSDGTTISFDQGIRRLGLVGVRRR